MDPADALLASRDPDGTPYDDDENVSEEEWELFHRVQEDRERRRRRRRTVAAAVIAFAVLVAGLAVARRANHDMANEGSAPSAVAVDSPASSQVDSQASSQPTATNEPARDSAGARSEQTARTDAAGVERPAAPAAPRAQEAETAARARASRESEPQETSGRTSRDAAARSSSGDSESRATESSSQRSAAERSGTPGARREARPTQRDADASADSARTAPREAPPVAREAAPPSPAVELPERNAAPRTAARAERDTTTVREARGPRERASNSPPPVARTPPPPPVASAPAATSASPDLRVEVAQNVDRANSAVDYTVRVLSPDGRPVTDADVRLRGVTTDGVLVEAPLEPAGTPGVYSGLIAFSSRGPRGLTVRVARSDRVIEVPVSGPGTRTQ